MELCRPQGVAKMEIKVRAANVAAVKTPVLALPSFGPPFRNSTFVALDESLGGALRRIAREEGFKGTSGQTLAVTGLPGTKSTRILVMGLGSPKTHDHG